VQEKHGHGTFLNGTVKNEIVSMFINPKIHIFGYFFALAGGGRVASELGGKVARVRF